MPLRAGRRRRPCRPSRRWRTSARPRRRPRCGTAHGRHRRAEVAGGGDANRVIEAGGDAVRPHEVDARARGNRRERDAGPAMPLTTSFQRARPRPPPPSAPPPRPNRLAGEPIRWPAARRTGSRPAGRAPRRDGPVGPALAWWRCSPMPDRRGRRPAGRDQARGRATSSASSVIRSSRCPSSCSSVIRVNTPSTTTSTRTGC